MPSVRCSITDNTRRRLLLALLALRADGVASQMRWRERGIKRERGGVAEFLKGINLLHKNTVTGQLRVGWRQENWSVVGCCGCCCVILQLIFSINQLKFRLGAVNISCVLFFIKPFVFQIHVFINVNMEPMKIDSPSDQSVVKVRSFNSTKDFLKSHKKTVSMGVIVIGVLAIVSSVLSVTASGSSQQGYEIAMQTFPKI